MTRLVLFKTFLAKSSTLAYNTQDEITSQSVIYNFIRVQRASLLLQIVNETVKFYNSEARVQQQGHIFTAVYRSIKRANFFDDFFHFKHKLFIPKKLIHWSSRQSKRWSFFIALPHSIYVPLIFVSYLHSRDTSRSTIGSNTCKSDITTNVSNVPFHFN